MGALSFAIRELQRDFSDRRTLIALAGCGLILGLSGPFDTLRLMPTLPRVGYWSFVVFACYALGDFSSSFMTYLLRRRGVVKQAVASAIVTGVLVTAFVTATNWVLFGNWLGSAGEALQMLGVITFISVVIEAGHRAIGHHAPPETGGGVAQVPRILARLPLEKRGTLIAISATDHYVNVVTSAGEALVLMRLSDAVAECGDIGLRVHRSHWVALDQVRSARKDKGAAQLVLANGMEIPVSRSYLPRVKEAGLLER